MACYLIKSSLSYTFLHVLCFFIIPFVHLTQSSTVPFTTSSLNKSLQLYHHPQQPQQQQQRHQFQSISPPHPYLPHQVLMPQSPHQREQEHPHQEQLLVTNDVTNRGYRFRRDASSDENVNTTTNANIDTNELNNLSGEGEIKTEASLSDANGNYYDYTASLLEASASPESLSDGGGRALRGNPHSEATSEMAVTSSTGDDLIHVTPFFIITREVCNAPRSTILRLEATGSNLTYSLVEPSQIVTIDAKSKRLILIDTVDFKELTVKIWVKRNVSSEEIKYDTLSSISSLLPTPGTTTSSSGTNGGDGVINGDEQMPGGSKPAVNYFTHENQIQLRLLFSKSYCHGSESKATIIIVTLSVVCLFLLSCLTLVLVILRRKKPYFFGAKGEHGPTSGQGGGHHHHESCSNQVAPCDHVNGSSGPYRSKDKSITNGVLSIMTGSRNHSIALPDLSLKPRKSSLKPPKPNPLPQVPEVTIIPGSPPASEEITSPTGTSITSGINSSPASPGTPNDSTGFTNCAFTSDCLNGVIKCDNSYGNFGKVNTNNNFSNEVDSLLMVPLNNNNNKELQINGGSGGSSDTLGSPFKGNLNDVTSASSLSLNESSNRLNTLSPSKLSPNESPEKRRRSVVTFNETTQIIQIGKKK